MFDKVKEAMKWQKIQSEIKRQQEQIFATVEKRDVKVVIRGDKKIEKIEIDGEENKSLKDAVNEAMKEVDKKLEKKLRGQAGDLGLPDL